MMKPGAASVLLTVQDDRGNEAIQAFDIDVDLTDEGKQHVDDIVTEAFRYINLLRAQGLQSWRVDEMRQLKDLDFRFREKAPASSEVLSLASNLLNYPADLALKGPYLVTDFDRKTTSSLAGLLRPDNMRLIVVDQDLKTDRTEPFYQTAYRVSPLKQSEMTKWNHPGKSASLALPARNPYIPQNIAIKKGEVDSEVPQRIAEKPGLEIWHKKDNEFRVPFTDFSAGLLPAIRSQTVYSLISTLRWLTMR